MRTWPLFARVSHCRGIRNQLKDTVDILQKLGDAPSHVHLSYLGFFGCAAEEGVFCLGFNVEYENTESITYPDVATFAQGVLQTCKDKFLFVTQKGFVSTGP